MSKTTTLADLNTMNLTALTAVYNALSDKPIKKFSCSREQAVAKIIALQPKAATKAKGEKKEKGPMIGSRIVELLKAKTSPADVLTAIQKEFKDCKTSIKCVYWYNCKIRSGGRQGDHL